MVTLNIQGTQGLQEPDRLTCDLGKLETLARLMIERKIDVYLLQETWQKGDWIKDISTPNGNITAIHHGPEETTAGRGGVAILLGPRAQKAWTAARRPEPYRPGPIIDGNTRFMGIELLWTVGKKQQERYFIGNVYAPHSGLVAKDPTSPGMARATIRPSNEPLIHSRRSV